MIEPTPAGRRHDGGALRRAARAARRPSRSRRRSARPSTPSAATTRSAAASATGPRSRRCRWASWASGTGRRPALRGLAGGHAGGLPRRALRLAGRRDQEREAGDRQRDLPPCVPRRLVRRRRRDGLQPGLGLRRGALLRVPLAGPVHLGRRRVARAALAGRRRPLRGRPGDGGGSRSAGSLGGGQPGDARRAVHPGERLRRRVHLRGRQTLHDLHARARFR